MIEKNVPTLRQNSQRSGSRHRAKASPSGPNLKITIEYDGAGYSGWQVQNKHQVGRKSQKPTVQATIEKVLRRILQEKIRLIGSGRTDAGVHALAQVANFHTKSSISLRRLQWALNGNLPEDITITAIEQVGPGFHSRFSAKSKIYRYLILNRGYPSALLRNRVYFCHVPLDIALMRRQAKILVGKHDFKAFCASGSGAKDTIRQIKKITIKRIAANSGDLSLIAIDIEADGFLYNMVRNIAGTLLEIGRGRFPAGSMKKILLSKNRKLAGPALAAHGLSLLEVKY